LSSIADEPTVQGVRRTSGWLPLRCIHLRGLQGESSRLILDLFFLFHIAPRKSKLKTNQRLYISRLHLILNLHRRSR